MAEPVGRNSAPPSYEIKRRDELDVAVKVSKRLADAKVAEDTTKRVDQTAQRREEIRSTADDTKKTALAEEALHKNVENQDKRRAQEKANPEAGNIINVVA